MKILFINGGCLTVNSSANLCHIAYINGILEDGHDLTVYSTSTKGQIVDSSIKLPSGASYKYYERSILYNFIKPAEWKEIQNNIQNNNRSVKTSIVKYFRTTLQKCYGPFGYNGMWVKNVVRHADKGQHYDLVISVSSPVYSHLAAINLLKKKRVTADRFVEIWEDPWQLDLYNQKVDPKLKELEHYLIRQADKVIYVSPLTAKYQSEMFPDCSTKITWAPLPYYYKDDEEIDLKESRYGYFGDYFPVSRNLAPFYQAACETGIHVDICGSPNSLFKSTEKIQIHPRLSLADLRTHEHNTNILVFLCNLKGGQIPGKIYQYSATRKKILFILDGTAEEKEIIKDFFKKYNRYYFCQNDVDDIINTLSIIERKMSNDVHNECVEDFSPLNIVRYIMEKIY